LPDRPARRASLLAPLRHRDFRLLWIGASASLAGDGVYLIALAWQAYTLSHTPSALAMLGVAATVPQLLALLGSGILSDRVERRRILLGADVIRFVAVLVVAVLVMSGQTRMWQLAVLSVVYGLGAGVAAPAFDAIIPDLVPEHDLQQANALDQFLRPAMLRLGGPALGGVLIAVNGAGTAFLFDAVTFLVSALCMWQMRTRPRAVGLLDPGQGPSMWADAVAGVRFVRSRTWLWGTFASATVAFLLFMGPTEVLLPYLVKEVLHGTATDLGIILGAGGVGAIAAALIVGQLGLPRRQLTFMYLCWTVAALAVAGYGLATTGWQLMIFSLVINGLEAVGTVVWATTKQRLVPVEMLGRVSSLEWFFTIAGLPVSYALTAPVAALIGAQGTFIAAGLLCAGVTFAALFLPRMRDADGALSAARQLSSTGRSRGRHRASGRCAGAGTVNRVMLQDALSNAFYTKDAEGLQRLFSTTATVTYAGSESGEKATGPAELRLLLSDVLARPMSYSFEFGDITFSEHNRLVWLVADGDCTQTDADGGTEAFPYRLTGVLAHEGARWRWLMLAGSEPTPV